MLKQYGDLQFREQPVQRSESATGHCNKDPGGFCSWMGCSRRHYDLEIQFKERIAMNPKNKRALERPSTRMRGQGGLDAKTDNAASDQRDPPSLHSILLDKTIGSLLM